MTINTELKEIREMLRKIIKDMTKIRQAQKQMKDEMYDVKDDLKKFKELWKKEKADIECRLQKLEEEKVKNEIMQRLVRFEEMEKAIEMKEKKNNKNINSLDVAKSNFLQESEINNRLNNLTKHHHNYGSTVNIKYKQLCTNEKSMIFKEGPRLIKQFFGAGKTDL